MLPQPSAGEPAFAGLDEGERQALRLGVLLPADLVLVDDRKAVGAAVRAGLVVTGTLGVLIQGAQRGLVDLGEAISKLKDTNFRYRQEMLDELMRRYG